MSKTKMSKKEMEQIAFRNAAIDKITQKRLYNLEKTKPKNKKSRTGLGKILGKLGTLNVGPYKPFK